MSETIEKVETFIRRLHNLEYVITSEAREILYRDSQDQVPKNLADWLSRRIFSYEDNKDDEERQLFYAQLCLIWINKAFTCGVVQEGKSLIKKLDEYREKNVQLERDNKVLSEEFLNLQMVHAEFSSRMSLIDEKDLADER